MGGCASKPKNSNILPESLLAQDKNGGESVKRAPLVDLSKPKEESAETSEPEAVEVEPVASVEAEARPEVVVEAKPAESADAANPETLEQKVEIANALAEEKDKFVAMAEEKVEAVEKPEEPTVVEEPKEEKASDATITPATQDESED